ncbi:ral GTPase-activating protein subunit beta-like [Tropilaelaps mercedesae]|uniref:Ral GTPase-activating protein subunit beta-like n=1 Tax=Tropilaelaps mercedesae TaxID=418985 RepID=A0A1V9XNN9_9ACAR|nr:ral GTPase-activating protein subunit beta-like [Tropilaelaps mercedesae]
MYGGWSELRVCEEARERSASVLQKFPTASSGAVVHAVVQSLAQSLGLSSGQPEPSTLITDVEVNWCMEVMCYGLRLPLKEHEAIKNCVHVYCDWLVSLIPEQAKICVPRPVMSDANHYSRRILRHLYNLFSPRPHDPLTADVASRQAVLCHRVLRTVQTVATRSPVLEGETWQEILCFLLAINDTLLSDRQAKDDDIEAHLCERLLGVLFQVWLMACHRSFFPSPSFWKTLQCLCLRWRHRQILVEQWKKIQLIMTAKLCRELLDPDYPDVRIEDGDKELVPTEMRGERLGQAWYRMLHTLGDPVHVARDPAALNGTLTHNMNEVHENQAQIFHKAMASVSAYVDVWLGRYSEDNAYKLILPSSTLSTSNSQAPSAMGSSSTSTTSTTPPPLRKNKPKAGQKLHIPQLITQHKPQTPVSPVVTPTGSSPLPPFPVERPGERYNTVAHVIRRLTLHAQRPSVNSLLHLYGTWLFESSMMTDSEGAFLDSETESLQSHSSQPDATHPSSTKSMSDSDSMYDSQVGLQGWSLEWGQAEALGTLCKILGSKTSDEEVLSVYLARFFLAIKQGLAGQSPQDPPNVITCSVVANSADLFKCDLESAALLMPSFVAAIETILSPPHVRSGYAQFPQSPIAENLLHNSAISILLSLLPLTLHSGSLHVRDQANRQVSLGSFRTRLLRLLLLSLTAEVDSLNVQTLLQGLMCAVLDQVEYERSAAMETSSDTNSASTEDPVFQDTHLVFIAIKAVCQNLSSSWKSDAAIVFSALEVLTVFARLHITEFASHNYREYRQCVGWLCELIVWQSHRPTRDHSKELHSTIVAAFSCLTLWLVEHSTLFCEQDTIHQVMEVVELGISGAKSQPKPSDIPVLKQNKERKPLSKRVLQAAEAVLSALMDHVGYFPNAAGPECPVSSLLDEQALLKERPGARFRYFYTQSSAIVGVLEDPIHAPPTSNPSLTLLVRAPFGRHVWAMQLSNVPQSKMALLNQGPVHHRGPPGAPMVLPRYQMILPNKEQLASLQKKLPAYFPPKCTEIPSCVIEKSVVPDPWNMPDNTINNNLLNLVEAQVKLEASCRREAAQRPTERPCRPPPNQAAFQTARLFLMHFGFLNPHDEGKKPSQSLLPLADSDDQSLWNHLQTLDQMSARSADTVHAFYVRRGQSNPEEIVLNSRSANLVHPLYLEFLRSLGWPVDVAMHIGWTGNVETSWKVSGDMDLLDLPSNHGGSLYDGTHQVLYWADVLSEMAFVVPSLPADVSKKCPSPEKDKNPTSPGVRIPGKRHPPEKPPRSNMTLNLDKTVKTTGTSRNITTAPPFEVKVMVVWLESFEDHSRFPLEGLLSYTDTTGLPQQGMGSSHRGVDVLMIFVMPLQSGLFRLKVECRSGSRTTAVSLPALDGQLISRRTLGAVVRNVALNLCRRKRLDADPESCPAPHVKRRAKIQEIGCKFSKELPSPEFYASLFARLPIQAPIKPSAGNVSVTSNTTGPV